MDRYANFCNFSGILFAKYRIPLYIEITKQVHLDHGDVVSRAKDFLKCKFHDLLDPNVGDPRSHYKSNLALMRINF